MNTAIHAERCLWCGQVLTTDDRTGFRRVYCTCGVGTTVPHPTGAELDAAYGTFYRPPTGRFAGPGDSLLRYTRGLLARRLDRIAPPGPVLDVGAGDGTLLDALHERGRDALGIERHSTRPDVVDSEIDQAGTDWAAIVMWHSLEHMPDPARTLALAAEHLAPGGVLILALPNAASLQARLFGDRWFALDLPRHLSHLPAELVRGRLAELGLQVERVSHWRGGQVTFGWLHGLVGLLPGRPDFYDAIRRPEARAGRLGTAGGWALRFASAILTPVALAAAMLEIGLRRGGTVYIEARRA